MRLKAVMAAMLRRLVPVVAHKAKPRHLAIATGPAAALWLGAWLKKPEPPPRCEEVPLVALQPVKVSPWQLVGRMLELSIWLLPISLMMFFGIIGKDSSSELGAALLARCLERCGPTFVKLGQWLATRRDFFSEETCQQLCRLQEGVQQSFTVEEKELVSKCALGGLKLSAVECERPIGQGCVAQVYSAQLEDGRKVAVKLRRPMIRQQVALDVAILRLVGSAIERCCEDLKWLSLQDGINAFSGDMEKQLDFRVEAHNLVRLQSNFSQHRHVRVPDVHLATEDMLVTTFVGGQSLSKLLSKGASHMSDAVRNKLWSILGRMVSKMVFADNFVHQDLHPGNIRVEMDLSQGDVGLPPWLLNAVEGARLAWPFGKAPLEVYLLDAGLASPLPRQKIELMAQVVQGGVCGQPDKAGAAFLEAHERQGLAEYATAKDEFARVIGLLAQAAMITQQDWQSLGFKTQEEYQTSGIGVYFSRMARIFADHKIRMDYEIWSLLTSFALIEGSMIELSGNRNVMRCVLPYVLGSGSVFLRAKGLQALSASEKRTSVSKPQEQS